MSLHLLEELGFEHAATWSLDQDCLSIAYRNYRDTTNVLYAFVSNRIIKYIGVTERSLSNRMLGYRLPGRGQATNIRVNFLIKQLLNQGNNLEVFCLGRLEDVLFRGIRINLPAGIENALIIRVADYHGENELPVLWNIRGNRRPIQGLIQLEAVQEEIAENMIYLEATPEETQDVGTYSDIYVKLGSAYYNGSFFNSGKISSDLLGAGGEEIVVDCLGQNPRQIVGTINRTHNPNETPRIMLGSAYTEWVQANYVFDDIMTVRIMNPNHIQLCSRR